MRPYKSVAVAGPNGKRPDGEVGEAGGNGWRRGEGRWRGGERSGAERSGGGESGEGRHSRVAGGGAGGSRVVRGRGGGAKGGGRGPVGGGKKCRTRGGGGGDGATSAGGGIGEPDGGRARTPARKAAELSLREEETADPPAWPRRASGDGRKPSGGGRHNRRGSVCPCRGKYVLYVGSREGRVRRAAGVASASATRFLGLHRGGFV